IHPTKPALRHCRTRRTRLTPSNRQLPTPKRKLPTSRLHWTPRRPAKQSKSRSRFPTQSGFSALGSPPLLIVYIRLDTLDASAHNPACFTGRFWSACLAARVGPLSTALLFLGGDRMQHLPGFTVQ